MSGPESDSIEARILDAAMRVLVDFGCRQATVELTAGYAAVSPAAVHVRWPTKAELLLAAVHRELAVIVNRAFDDADEDSFDDVLVSAFGGVVWAVHNHPLMRRELGTSPESALRLMSTESGPVMDAAAGLVADRFRRAAVATERALDDPEALADTFVRLAHGLLLVPDPDRPLTSRHDIESYARRFLLPVAQSQLTAAPTLTRPMHLRGNPFHLVAPLVLALVLGSGALVTVLAHPWSAPVTPTTVNDSGSIPIRSTEVTTTSPRPAESGAGILQTSPAAAPPPLAPVAPAGSAPRVTTLRTVDVQQPAGTPSPGANGPRTGPTQGPPPPPKSGTRPPSPAPGVPRQTVRPREPAGSQPGGGPHAGAPGAGPQ